MDVDLEGMFSGDVYFKNEELQIGDITLKLKSIEEQNCHLRSQVSQIRWPAAVPLCKYLTEEYFKHETKELPSMNGLELGAGTGIVGILLILKEKLINMTFSDRDPKSIEIIKENLKLNLCNPEEYKYLCFDWAECQKITAYDEEDKKFELLIGSDIIYSADALPSLVQTIKLLMKKKGECVLSSHTIRINYLEQTLFELCKKNGLSIEFLKYADAENKIKLHIVKHC